MEFSTIYPKIRPVTENDYFAILFLAGSVLHLLAGEPVHILLSIVFTISAILSYIDWW